MLAGMAAKDDLGRLGEEHAAAYLTECGWDIRARNWRCGTGEIDIVAVDGTDLVVVEVKTRRTASYGTPAEAVTRRKMARLRSLAACYLNEHPHGGGARIDVIAVMVPFHDAVTLEHLRGVQ